MKKLLILAAVFAVTAAHAQSQIDFSASLNGASVVPQNATFETASGTFSLIGNTLNYTISGQEIGFAPSDGFLGGPASPGFNGGVVFDLGNVQTAAPGINGQPAVFDFSGSFTLGTQQASDLKNGLWYVQITSSPVGGSTPQIRGQILAVPEPATYCLFFMGLAGMFMLRSRKVV